jgi:capsular exopolysaccharide synthesis family protein
LSSFGKKAVAFISFSRKKVLGEDTVGHGNRLINDNTSSRVLEAYRMARTNLMYTGKGDDSCYVIGFTGASPHDGKSLTCANLAISFAMSGKRVLLIDGDMHRPTQSISFGVQVQNGLSEYLAGICEEPEVSDTAYENVKLLSSGRCPPNPAELLYSDRFGALIADMKEKYDCVFLDLPPINVISDAAIVSPHLDGFVCVIRAGRSEKRHVQTLVDSIMQVNGKILGFLLNDVERKTFSYNRGGYYYGGYYYGGYYYGGYYYGRKQAAEDAEAEKKTAEAEEAAVTVTEAAAETATDGSEGAQIVSEEK